jgi:hypothetical protein
MKQFFFKKPKAIIKPCSSDRIGCDYHIELFGSLCLGCIHQLPKDRKSKQPKSAPLIPISKA